MIRNEVKLPDGLVCLEQEDSFGQQETQRIYTYYTKYDSDLNVLDKASRLDVRGYARDYWGRVKNLHIL